jgi:hypothetical protein
VFVFEPQPVKLYASSRSVIVSTPDLHLRVILQNYAIDLLPVFRLRFRYRETRLKFFAEIPISPNRKHVVRFRQKHQIKVMDLWLTSPSSNPRERVISNFHKHEVLLSIKKKVVKDLIFPTATDRNCLNRMGDLESTLWIPWYRVLVGTTRRKQFLIHQYVTPSAIPLISHKTNLWKLFK